MPAVLTLLWSGKWDSLPAAHATAIAFDLLVVLGLFLVGRRFGGEPLGVALAFGWLAFPFSAYALNANSNDAIMPAFLVWGFWLCTSSFSRGAAVALSGWSKFATLLLAPLWLTYPNGLRLGPASARRRLRARDARGVLDPPARAERDPRRPRLRRPHLRLPVGRDSPFSPWDWGQYHARGIPDLSAFQVVLQVGVLALAGVAAVLPRRKSPLELAALTAAVLVGFELALTHWSYLYIPWFLPFVLLALLLPRRNRRRPLPWRRGRRRRSSVRELRAGDAGPVSSRAVFLAIVAAALALLVGLFVANLEGGPGISDTPVYQGYGDRIEDGRVPYRDFTVEYPPLALVPFALPSLLSSTQSGYDAVFQALMIFAFAGCTVLLVVSLDALRASTARIVGSVGAFWAGIALLGPFLMTRFDLFATLVTLAAMTAILRRRSVLGPVLLGLAIATKIYPAVLLPLLVLRAAQRRDSRAAIRACVLTLGTAALVYLPFAIVAPDGVARSVWRQAERPLQIESLGSGVLLGLHHAFGMPLGLGVGIGVTEPDRRGRDRRGRAHHARPRRGAAARLDALRPRRHGERRTLRPLLGRGDRGVRRSRQGAFAAVPRLGGRCGRTRAGDARDGRDRAHAPRLRPHQVVVPEYVLGAREAVRSRGDVARAASRPRAPRRARHARGAACARGGAV